ncbi:hypothetical protein AWB69_02000 [Caballeronia udeis]|uniref:Uncharacterized protein n=1 Tax=Caballeronia udeis TaxID=1232866 RepID=A0A158G5H9_9BURK|nr:hypothetical protein AWB69_02000 [Caballeronia udeis]
MFLMVYKTSKAGIYTKHEDFAEALGINRTFYRNPANQTLPTRMRQRGCLLYGMKRREADVKGVEAVKSN